MGRWTQYDEDDYRLPEGVKRIGYDSDTGRYYFRDRAGIFYQGPEGSEFGELTRVSDIPIAVPDESDGVNDLEAAPSRSDGYQALAVDEHGTRFHPRSAYRTIFPFFLIIAVVMLLVWRLFFLPTHVALPPCPTTTLPYFVKSGDTCWDIANRHNSSLEKFRIVNPKVNCDKLLPGDRVCVPEEALKNGRRRPRY